MMTLILEILLMVAAAGLIHELGHLIAARILGHTLRFRLEFGKPIMIPRGIWTMPPNLTYLQKNFIALSGFLCEFLAAILAQDVLFFGIVALHSFLYPLYAGEKSDFQWLTTS
jgi:hypothetical protein